jgi:hypothetical protein
MEYKHLLCIKGTPGGRLAAPACVPRPLLLLISCRFSTVLMAQTGDVPFFLCATLPAELLYLQRPTNSRQRQCTPGLYLFPSRRRIMSTEYRNFLALSYEELEELNLAAKADRASRIASDQIREKRLKYLTDEKRIKAVTVLFSDLEGRLHLLDYDKKFLLGAYENLTFDGSSIRGFTAQKESDLRLGIDWSSFYWVPADVFGTGKVLVFGNVIDKDGTAYSGDLRGVLKSYADKLFADKGYTLNAATEIEGFLFAGKDAEQTYHQTGKFEFISSGGYYH